jgi:putative ABC transport system substrate-binding protein
MTTRRDFVALAASAAVVWPVAAPAQPGDGMRRLGVLMSLRVDDPEGQAYAAALVQGLGALKWHDGDNLRIDWRWALGDPVLVERYATELAASETEVLVAFSTTSVEALRRRTSTIPIVFVVVTDPVGQGLVQSLARPGGNVTGFSSYDAPMAGKWLEMLTQIAPPVARVGVLFNPVTAPYAGLMLHAIKDAAASLSVTVRAVPFRDDAEIEVIMAGLASEERGGLLVLQDASAIAHRNTIVALAARHRLPAVYPYRFITALGGLMSYGSEYIDLFRRAAAYVDRILKGAKPGELPVQNPTRFELVINLKTAKALGITIPSSLLSGADEVIE